MLQISMVLCDLQWFCADLLQLITLFRNQQNYQKIRKRKAWALSIATTLNILYTTVQRNSVHNAKSTKQGGSRQMTFLRPRPSSLRGELPANAKGRVMRLVYGFSICFRFFAVGV